MPHPTHQGEIRQDGGPAAELPSQGLRTFMSFLLFVHLFALAVAILSQTGTVSGFERELFRRTGLGYYLDALGMDLGYDFHLTHNMQSDYDHVLDVVLETPKGFRGDDEDVARQGLKTISVMPEETWPGARRRRYLNLALPIYIFSEEDIVSDISQAVVSGTLAQHEIESGKHLFRCRTLAPRGWGAAERDNDPYSSGYYVNDYQADVVATGPGEWSLVKVVGEGEATQLQDNASQGAQAPSGDSQGGQQ